MELLNPVTMSTFEVAESEDSDKSESICIAKVAEVKMFSSVRVPRLDKIFPEMLKDLDFEPSRGAVWFITDQKIKINIVSYIRPAFSHYAFMCMTKTFRTLTPKSRNIPGLASICVT